MRSDFPRAINIVLLEEGPMSNNATTSDPDGGLTQFGISKTQHPDVPGLFAWWCLTGWSIKGLQ